MRHQHHQTRNAFDYLRVSVDRENAAELLALLFSL